MKQYLCLLAMLCLFFRLPAQETARDAHVLSIGDQVPEVFLESILNHPNGKGQLSDYRGKWLILDFWATWCSPCIYAFPKLDSLQEIFKEKVQFLPVAYQTRAEVEKLVAQLDNRKGFSIDLPLVVADTALHALFPHRELPYYIWIDPKGKVVATTGPDEVTVANIEAMVNNETSAVKNKKYVDIPFNKNDLLVAGNGKIKKSVQFQSALLPYIEGLPTAYTKFPTDPEQGKRILATNAKLLSLYQLAYSGADVFFSKNRIVLEVEDSSALIRRKDISYSDWLRNGHAWCYELIVPPEREDQIKQIMQEDLQRFFPLYRASVQERKVPCLALIRIKNKGEGQVKPLETQGGDYKAKFSFFGGELRNGVLTDLIARLNAFYLQHLPTPIIDETGYSGRVDLTLEADMGDVGSIRKALQGYGLDLVQMKKKIKVLVIEEADG